MTKKSVRPRSLKKSTKLPKSQLVAFALVGLILVVAVWARASARVNITDPLLTGFGTVDTNLEGSGEFASMAQGSDGLPIHAYYDSYTSGFKVAKCSIADCSIGNQLTVVDNTPSAGITSSIAIGIDGSPIISYYVSSQGLLKILKCGNLACSAGNTISTVDQGVVGIHSSMVIAPDGKPSVVYSDFRAGYRMKYMHCGTSDCSSGNIIRQLGNGFNGVLRFGKDNLPLIGIYDPDLGPEQIGSAGSVKKLIGDPSVVRILHCDDITCTSSTSAIVDADNGAGTYISMIVPADGLPAIMYGVSVTPHVRTFALKLAKCIDPKCAKPSMITIIDAADAGLFNAIALSKDGLPAMTYFGGGTIKFVKCSDPACKLAVPTVIAPIGSHINLAIDDQGLPAVSYWSGATVPGSLHYLKCGASNCMLPSSNKDSQIDPPKK